MGKTIIISNRIPVKVEKKGDLDTLVFAESIGGLVTGLRSVHDQSDSLWLGWCGLASDELNKNDMERIEQVLKEDYKSLPVHLNREEVENYYHGFSNGVIWPLFHYFPEYVDFDEKLWHCYKKVNEKFLEAACSVIEAGDRVWIHDYHLMLLPAMIKERHPEAKVGFFLHIPFPSYELFRLLPWREEVISGLLGSDLIGFHTYDYENHFLVSSSRITGYDHDFGLIHMEERSVKVDVFPMGIDYDRFSGASDDKVVKKDVAALIEKVAGKKVVLSVDRLDYTKGIPQRLAAIDEFLKNCPEYREKVSFIFIVAPSRTNVSYYKELLKKVKEFVSDTNGRHGSMGWVPIWFFYRTFSSEELINLYLSADVMLVTPLRDGMNLVAKEYLAARTDKLGVLVLSETAGAASELGESIIVNPNNTGEIARAIKSALEMEEEEKVASNTPMVERLKRCDVDSWAEDFIKKLDGLRDYGDLSETPLSLNGVFDELARDFEGAKKRLILLDYDGTVMPFFNSPDEARPDGELMELLKNLSANEQNRVVLISGRDKKDLDEWFGSLPIDLVGDHGMWLKKDGGVWTALDVLNTDWKAEVRHILELYRDRTPGSFIEEKSFSLSWHYRMCEPEMAKVRAGELKNALERLLTDLRLGILDGKKVIEIKDSTVNKGRGVYRWLEHDNWDFIFCAGDDVTDEDMFEVMPRGAYSVKVGRGPTRALYRTGSHENIRSLLSYMSQAKPGPNS